MTSPVKVKQEAQCYAQRQVCIEWLSKHCYLPEELSDVYSPNTLYKVAFPPSPETSSGWNKAFTRFKRAESAKKIEGGGTFEPQ